MVQTLWALVLRSAFVCRTKQPSVVLQFLLINIALADNVFFLYRKALENLGIPCFLGGMSRGMLGKNSPIHIRQNRRDALKEADLVLLAGQTSDSSNTLTQQ